MGQNQEQNGIRIVCLTLLLVDGGLIYLDTSGSVYRLDSDLNSDFYSTQILKLVSLKLGMVKNAISSLANEKYLGLLGAEETRVYEKNLVPTSWSLPELIELDRETLELISSSALILDRLFLNTELI